ncbi:hypothetical protein C7E25_25250, partial [Stenotrophomonas maltophilia]
MAVFLIRSSVLARTSRAFAIDALVVLHLQHLRSISRMAVFLIRSSVLARTSRAFAIDALVVLH